MAGLKLCGLTSEVYHIFACTVFRALLTVFSIHDVKATTCVNLFWSHINKDWTSLVLNGTVQCGVQFFDYCLSHKLFHVLGQAAWLCGLTHSAPTLHFLVLNQFLKQWSQYRRCRIKHSPAPVDNTATSAKTKQNSTLNVYSSSQ